MIVAHATSMNVAAMSVSSPSHTIAEMVGAAYRRVRYWIPTFLLSLCLNLFLLQTFVWLLQPKTVTLTADTLHIQLAAPKPAAKAKAHTQAVQRPAAQHTAVKDPAPEIRPPQVPSKPAAAPPPPAVQTVSQPTPPPPPVAEPEVAAKEPAPPPEKPSLPTTPKPVALYKLSHLPGYVLKVKPRYPAAERAAGREASVLVDILIDHSGKVREIHISHSGGPAFDAAVKTALEASRFTPGYVGNEAVAVRLQIPFHFQLD